MRKVLRFVFLILAVLILAISCGKDSKDSGPTGPDENMHDIFGIIFATITGGTFEMGDVEGFNGSSNEKPVHTVSVSPFEMSIYEVTNAQYASYLNEAFVSGDIEIISGNVYGKSGDWSGECYLNIGKSSVSGPGNNKCWIQHRAGTFSVTDGKETWPVVYVSWFGSKAFAEYYEFDLPTEAEWEYACRGSKQYMYGTDDGTIGIDKANYNGNIGYPTPVGSYPANPYGLYDMSGNVWEWCSDWSDDEYYSVSPSNDPTGPQAGRSRIIRGGNWMDYGSSIYHVDPRPCRSAARCLSGEPDFALRDIGFRVVRRPGGVIY
ncbi:formylglycine-generating enzyme family protein [Candidatus Latescibacterota bacterium]